jgi:hypothetical protein
MTRTIVTGEEGEELKRLYKEHADATAYACEVLLARGMESREFLDADNVVGEKWRRIREILGDGGKHWMA